jgi:hypothetical protein
VTEEKLMETDLARKRFGELRAKGGHVDPNELDEVWAALPTVRIEDILGSWKGDEFNTGHSGNGDLEASRWYGKTFNSVSDAHPLVCYGEDGELYSNLDMGNGLASLWMVEFRGEVTATMIYDGQPVFDHFKRVDENTLMGIMNGKGGPSDKGGYFYFLLERP